MQINTGKPFPLSMPPETQGTPAQKNIEQAGQSGNIQEYVRSSTNNAILNASLKVSIRSGDQSMQLLYKSAIENLNQILEPDFGKDALSAQAGQDQSPEAVAERIVSLTTGLFGKFLEQRPGVEQSAAAQQFREVLSQGIEQGFAEAREILEGLKVLDEGISSTIDKTYELVQSKLDEFFSRFTGGGREGGVTDPAIVET